MAAVAPGDTIGVASPKLTAYTATDEGLLADPYALSFQLFDITDEDVAPVQIYPPAIGDRAAVDLVADKLSTGHFAAACTIPGTAVTGRHQIRWYLEQTHGASERSWRRDFDVLPLVPIEPGESYALVADLRDEGVAATTKNRRILEQIARASDLIRRWTGRSFVPVAKQILVDAPRSLALLLDEPICAVAAVGRATSTPLDPSDYRVYSRHLTQGLLRPDDRDSPKIELIRASVARLAYTIPTITDSRDLGVIRSDAQGVAIDGVFGYTDREPGGSPVGVTPLPIRRATILLTLRLLPKAVAESDDAFDATQGHKVKRMKTREQEIEYFDAKASGGFSAGSLQDAPFTGDPEIDSILLSYQIPLVGSGV